MSNARRLFVLTGMFALAMGLLEAIVVVYLRGLYYPDGFNFPLQSAPTRMMVIETVREICTIVMLATVALIAGKNKMQKIAWFVYCFGIWDIFYYVGLKVFLNWPPSLLTWDLLFLIPVAWVGPVLSPLICSLTMVVLAACIIILTEKGYNVNISLFEGGLYAGGVLLIFVAFIWDFSRLIIKEDLLGKMFNLLGNHHFNRIMAHYKPENFAWPIFITGEILLFLGMVSMVRRIIHNKTIRRNNYVH